MTSQKPISQIDPKQCSALLHACNWWTKMHFATLHSVHVRQDVGREDGGHGGKRNGKCMFCRLT